jgi:hypothetical protein
MSKLGILAMTLGVLAIVAAPANAQSINKNAKEKVRWYTAPREIQIIDDRPVVKDFREAPAAAQSIQLPPGPQSGGGYGGGGGGAMGGDDGGTLPAGGMPMGGGGPGYRTDAPGGPVGLPKADFGHAQTNIPARGMGPRGPLPGGYTTNRLAGKMMPWSPGQGVNPNVGRSMGGSRPVARQAAAPAATYAAPGGGYGPSVGGGSYGGGGSSTSVSAKLLKKIK